MYIGLSSGEECGLLSRTAAGNRAYSRDANIFTVEPRYFDTAGGTKNCSKKREFETAGGTKNCSKKREFEIADSK